MTGFWKAWMQAWCWVVIGVGAMFALAGFPATDIGARLFYDVVYWPIDGASAFDADMRFTVSILGCVMIGWAITLMGLVDAAGLAGRPAWRSMTAAVLVWYLIDSTLSVLTGVPVNAVSNTGFLLTFLAPVLGSGVLGGHAQRASA